MILLRDTVGERVDESSCYAEAAMSNAWQHHQTCKLYYNNSFVNIPALIFHGISDGNF